jgi:hypothetical protein
MDTANIPISLLTIPISLPGRPVAEKTAHHLVATGVNFEGITFGSYGPDTLHLFKQLCPDSVFITAQAHGTYILEHATDSDAYGANEIRAAIEFPDALSVAHYARSWFQGAVKAATWFTAPEALALGEERLTVDELNAAIAKAKSLASGTGLGHRTFLAKTITEAISEKRYAAITDALVNQDTQAA